MKGKQRRGFLDRTPKGPYHDFGRKITVKDEQEILLAITM
jgi:hypothetical protein